MKKINFIIVLILLVRPGGAQKVEKDFTDAFSLIEVWLDAHRDFEKLPGITAIVVEDQETLYPPSAYWQYSNLGLTLLGQIIEEVSGLAYDDYISQKILDPLYLDNTRTELPESLYGEQLCIGYGSVKRSGERDKVDFFQANGI